MFKLYKCNYLKKIKEFEGEENSPIINYWEKEIKNFKKKREEQERELRKK